VYAVCKTYGVPVELFFESEANLIRDEYGSIVSRSTSTSKSFLCHPVEVNPSQKSMEKVGIRETVDILIYLSTYEWTLQGLGYKDLDLIRGMGAVLGENYKLEHRKLYSNFAGDYIYIVLGAVRN
jgi:hypothetical protein